MRVSGSAALALFVACLSAWGVLDALRWPWPAALFPLAIGIPLFLLASLETVLGLAGPADGPPPRHEVSPGVAAEADGRLALTTWVWILAGFFAVIGVGFPAAVFLFVAAYLRLEGRQPWIRSSLLAAGAWLTFYVVFERLLHVPFPGGWLIP